MHDEWSFGKKNDYQGDEMSIGTVKYVDSLGNEVNINAAKCINSLETEADRINYLVDQLAAAGFQKRADYRKKEYYRIAAITDLLRNAVVRLIL